jgi:hypothetical protein
MSGYSLDEIRVCIQLARALPFPRVHRRPKLARFFIVLADAFEELNNALVEAMRNSNHDGKWN